jgi:hypothetical protein
VTWIIYPVAQPGVLCTVSAEISVNLLAIMIVTPPLPVGVVVLWDVYILFNDVIEILNF